MSTKLCRIVQVLAALILSYCGLGIINTTISLKYERQTNECISFVTGRNLCHLYRFYWLGLGGALALIVAVSFWEHRTIKRK